MTKNKSKPIALLVAAMLMGTMSFAQSIHFNYTDGTNASYNLEDVRKITFDADVMNLHLWDGSTFAWNVSIIDHYKYDESSVHVNEWLSGANAWEVNVYPNPASTSLNVSVNLSKADAITIGLYDIQGKLMLEKFLGNRLAGKHLETLDINDLPSGTYVCRISSTGSVITKRVIKQ